MGGCSSDDSEARDFADNHFYESVYRNVEFNVALSSVYGDSGSYAGSMDDTINRKNRQLQCLGNIYILNYAFFMRFHMESINNCF